MMIITRKNFKRIVANNPAAILVDFAAQTRDPDAAGVCIDGMFTHFDIYQDGAPSDGSFYVKLFRRFTAIPTQNVYAV